MDIENNKDDLVERIGAVDSRLTNTINTNQTLQKSIEESLNTLTLTQEEIKSNIIQLKNKLVKKEEFNGY